MACSFRCESYTTLASSSLARVLVNPHAMLTFRRRTGRLSTKENYRFMHSSRPRAEIVFFFPSYSSSSPSSSPSSSSSNPLLSFQTLGCSTAHEDKSYQIWHDKATTPFLQFANAPKKWRNLCNLFVNKFAKKWPFL